MIAFIFVIIRYIIDFKGVMKIIDNKVEEVKECIEEAIKARIEAEEKLFKEFRREYR